jgi:RNA-directed DNA polymerase
VTQDNAGKKAAGVDGLKSLVPHQRLSLVERLKSNWGKASATRRVWIPKPGSSEEQRPLNIPTLEDRARQTLFKLALEPQWEAKFEPNSYGFRPGRSCHDAIMAIYLKICHLPKWILDADLAKCFDTIAQEPLLKKLKASPFVTRQIRAWLQAEVMDNFSTVIHRKVYRKVEASHLYLRTSPYTVWRTTLLAIVKEQRSFAMPMI